MSIVHMSSTRKYWSEKYGFDKIRNIMSVNTFEKIRKSMHFNYNSKQLPKGHTNEDRLYKLRPVIDFLNTKFSSVLLEESLALGKPVII
jgi:hypothetical protein